MPSAARVCSILGAMFGGWRRPAGGGRALPILCISIVSPLTAAYTVFAMSWISWIVMLGGVAGMQAKCECRADSCLWEERPVVAVWRHAVTLLLPARGCRRRLPGALRQHHCWWTKLSGLSGGLRHHQHDCLHLVGGCQPGWRWRALPAVLLQAVRTCQWLVTQTSCNAGGRGGLSSSSSSCSAWRSAGACGASTSREPGLTPAPLLPACACDPVPSRLVRLLRAPVCPC